MGTTKNKGQKDKLDRFYTPVNEAMRLTELVLQNLDINKDTVLVEPSAGDGAFVRAMEDYCPDNRIIALDIAPSSTPLCDITIAQNDYLQDDLFVKGFLSSTDNKQDVLIIGNPPFGEQGKLAVDFINKSLEYARYCAFILPPSFRKETMQKKLNGKVITVYDVLDDSYRVQGQNITVPSAFFIIDGEQQFSPAPDLSALLPFSKLPVSQRKQADFAIRRVGGTAGTAMPYNSELSSETYYFYKKKNDCPDNIIEIINNCEFPEKEWSVGPRSLSQKELAKHIVEALKTE